MFGISHSYFGPIKTNEGHTHVIGGNIYMKSNVEKMTKGLEARQEGRCSVYYEKKMRFCRQHVSKKAPEELSSNPDFKPLYCGNHYHLYANHIDNAKQPESSKRLKVTHGRKGKRIPCPLDPSHTIYEFMLSSHLKKCNKTKNDEEARAQVFYEDGINKGGHGLSITIKSNDELNPKSIDTNHLARQILIAFQNTFMRDSKKPIEALTDEDIYHAIKLKDYHQGEMDLGLESVTTKHQVKIGGEKHIIQIGSILGHCREFGLLDANIVLEMGAGRATTGFVVSGVCAKTKKVKLIIVERGGSRSKADTALRRKTKEDNADVSEPYLNVENVDLHRIKCDLAHVNITTVLKVIESDGFQLCQEVNSDGKPQKNVLMIAKHLCGAGTDLALKSIYPIRDRISGCILATCCHGLCNWSDYVGRSFLQKALLCDELQSFGDAEFEGEKYLDVY